MLDMTSQTVLVRLQGLMQMAWEEATKSPDPSTQLGAVLVGRDYFSDSQSISSFELKGHNHFGPNVPVIFWEDKDQKYKHVVHAETSVIFQAAKGGYPTKGAILVCGWACCFECAKAIVEAGIKSLVVDAKAMERSPERWNESIRRGHEYLIFHGVEIIYLKTTHPYYRKPSTRFDGGVW